MTVKYTVKKMRKTSSRPINLDEMKKLFFYQDGFLWWNVSRQGATKNALAGSIDSKGYRRVCVDGVNYQVHRILYSLYVDKEISSELFIDHIDGNRLNNKRSNLRLVTCAENGFNRKSAKGYTYNKRAKKFQASIKVNGKQIYLGIYDNELDARAAYLRAKNKLHIITER